MKKKLAIAVASLVLFSACRKNTQTACGTQVCTDVFASVGVRFIDKNNSPVQVTGYAVLDLRTNKILYNVISASADLVPGYMIVADDSDLKDLTTDGDNIRVTATNPTTGQTLHTIFKISGGCNCHVGKVSGPDTIQFN